MSMGADEWVRPADRSDRVLVRRLLEAAKVDVEFRAREFVVCEVGGRVVGCAHARPVPEGGTELAVLIVDERHRRRGLGRDLLATVLLGTRHPVYALAPDADLATRAGFQAIAPEALPTSLRDKHARLGGCPARLRRIDPPPAAPPASAP